MKKSAASIRLRDSADQRALIRPSLAQVSLSEPRGFVVPTIGDCIFGMSDVERIESEWLTRGDDAVDLELREAVRRASIDRRAVMRIFRVMRTDDGNETFWDGVLGRPPKWIVKARVLKGRPGASSLWDPILVAHGLLERKRMSIAAIDQALRKNLPDLLDEWKEQTMSLRDC
jgi:hypothetical protein